MNGAKFLVAFMSGLLFCVMEGYPENEINNQQIPVILRSEKTIFYDNSRPQCEDQSVAISFSTEHCESDTTAEAWISYSYDNDTSLTQRKSATRLCGDRWVARLSFYSVRDTIIHKDSMLVSSSHSERSYALHYKIWATNKWGTSSLPATNDSSLHHFTVQTRCGYLTCSSLSIRPNPIREDSCMLSVDLSGDRRLRLAVFHADGTPLEQDGRPLFNELEAVEGHNEWSMSDIFPSIFQMGIDPLEPLILAITSGVETSMTYFYVSKIVNNNSGNE